MRYVTKTRPVSTIDQLFDSMFYGTSALSEPVYSSFPVNITEEGQGYALSAELPGYNDSDVEITLNDNILVITAEKIKKADEENGDGEDRKYLLRERVSRKYKRSFVLPENADRESINASLKDGLLQVTIGKKPEAKPLTIKIN